MAQRAPVPNMGNPVLEKWLVDNVVDTNTGSVDPARVTTLETQMSAAQSDITDLEGVNTAEEDGTVTFATAATASVTFSSSKDDATYKVVVTGDVEETFWVTSKTTGGFTINSSNASSIANVDWIIRL